MRFSLFILVFILLGAGCTTAENAAVVSTSDADLDIEVVTTDDGALTDVTAVATDVAPEETQSEPVEQEAAAEQDVTVAETEVVVETNGEAAEEPEVLAPLAVTMTASNFAFSPTTINARPGQEVTVTFTGNEGFHDFLIDDIGVDAAIDVGSTVTFTAPSTPGSYPFYCSIGSHRALGMEGMLIVR